MKISSAIAKVEKATGIKMEVNANGSYYNGRISFRTQDGHVDCIQADGTWCNTISQAIKRIS